MLKPVAILFGALFTVAVSLALGKLLLRGLRIRLYRQEENVLGFVAGSACLSLVVFLLGAVGLMYKPVFLAVGALALGIAIRQKVFWPAGDPFPPLPRLWKFMFWGLFSLFSAVYFINAMAPETSADGTTYHLGLAARYLRERGFRPISTNMYASLSQGVEMLYTYAFAFGRHSAAALVHFSFLVVLALSLLSYARRFQHAVAGVLGALFVFLSPVVGMDGTTAYNDVATACIVFATFYLAQIWDQEREDGLLAPLGLVAGFCYAAKYVAFLGVLYAIGFVAWKLRRQKKPLLKPVLLVTGCAAVMIAPWILKNVVWSGNPFAPLLNRYFPNPYATVGFETEYRAHMAWYEGLKSYWDIPLEVTVRGQTLVGFLGPLFLLTPLALYALRWREGRRLLFAGALFLLTYPSNIGTRFLIAPEVFFALAVGMFFARWQRVALVVLLAHAVLSWPKWLTLYCSPHAWRLSRIPWKAALRIEPEEAYLNRVFPLYGVARMIEEHVPPGRKVFTFTGAPDAYTTREILVGYQSASNTVLADILLGPVTPAFHPTWRLSFAVPAAKYRALRVWQTGAAAQRDTYWSVSEFRVFLKDKELPRQSIWRLRAQPNPWDVQLAFDNSLATRWRSWQTMSWGMYVELDFGVAEEIDRVALDCARDQYGMKLWLEGQDESGRWKMLADRAADSGIPLPAGIHRLAAEEMKARGADYLLLYNSDFWAESFRRNELLYGITLLEERNGARLYRLK